MLSVRCEPASGSMAVDFTEVTFKRKLPKKPKPEKSPKMPKIELVALAATGLLLFGGVFFSAPAFAEDSEEKAGTSSEVDTQEGLEEETSETEMKHQELEEKYGKEGHLTLPPLVIRPEGYVDISGATLVGGASSFDLAPLIPQPRSGTHKNRPTETMMIDPEKNVEIDISTVSSARKTPAEVFIESATMGLFAMGFGAVGLGVVAGTRAIRRR